MARIIALVAVVLTLTGCGAVGAPGMVAATLASISTTKKTPTDHLISWLSGDDCSAVAMSQGKDYCKPRAEPTEQTAGDIPLDSSDVASGPYCYRTIGRVTCYSGPDPLASEYALLD